MNTSSKSHVRTTVEAVVYRANGTVEDRGVVGYWHKNPLRRILWRMTRKAT